MKNKIIRMSALDGLRGIAILLVIFNHLPLKIWYDNSPVATHKWLDLILVNGGIGVSFLFLLTGFLMAWLYPRPKTNVLFWSKRYARLFPAFLVMVTSLTIIKMMNNLSAFSRILLVLGIALLARIIWEFFLKIGKKIAIGKFLTYFWIGFQILVAGWYVFYLLKIPSPVFYQTWNKNLQWIVTGIVNSTLTLPFGNYIGQLDGVYWSLILETFFYLLYPVLFVPFLQYINVKKSNKRKFFLLLSIFVFCYSLNFISKRILAMRMMSPSMIIYFVIGTMIGSNLEWWQNKFLKLPKFFTKPANLIIILFICLSKVFTYPLSNSEGIQTLISMLFVIPTGILLVSTTLGEKSWGKFLENKFLVFFGKYSYALYLTHSLIIDISKTIIEPNSIQNSFIIIFMVLIGSVSLSWCLFHIIEEPYYKLPKLSINLEKERYKNIKLRFKKTYIGFGLAIFLILILAFRTPFSLTTYSYPHKLSNVLSLIENKNEIVVGGKNSFERELISRENNLGMVSIDVKEIKNLDKEDSTLFIKLLDSDKKIISESTFNISTMIPNNFYSFGFPVQAQSKDKKYFIEYEVEPKNSLDEIKINEKENQFVSVYFLDKKKLLKSPKLFSWWFFSKIREPLVSPLFWFYFILTMPMMILLKKINEK